MNETSLKELFSKNSDIMEILAIINQLNLNDCWLCAETLRNYVWNYLSKQKTSLISDVDIIFYDPDISYKETLEIEKNLKNKYPLYDWELKNQVYMNIHNPNTKPYLSSADALAKFPETCTAIGLRLDSNNQLELLAPCGIKDLVSLTIKPAPFFMENTDRMVVYHQRVEKKQWLKKWPELKTENQLA